jgi:SAM-dependent methyltransferase
MKEVRLLPYRMYYSVLRYYVDSFYAAQAARFKKTDLILDIGGEKKSRKGQFNINDYAEKVFYLNIDPETKPDFLSDAAEIPVKNNHFNVVVCSQLLEHVIDPIKVLKEIFRVLKPGGKLLLSTPFLYRIHPDPIDYARYTDFYWHTNLSQIGFKKIKVESHGYFFSVLANMFKTAAKESQKKQILISLLPTLIAGLLTQLAVGWDKKIKNLVLKSYSLGFGVTATKP